MPVGPSYPYKRPLTNYERKRRDRWRKADFKRKHPFLFDHHGKQRAA